MMTVFMPEALFQSEKSTKKLLRKLCAPTSDVFEKNENLLNHWNLLLKYFNNRSMMYHKYIKFDEQDFLILREKALFLVGEYDRLTNYPKSIDDLKKNNLNFKLIKDAGHGINHEQADLINSEIVKFLL
ncbi:MAG: alpha/beta hydrolase [Bacillota bacterium]|nr:alpha/beta hydrolase [Bacillota bacterium]